MRRFVTKSIEGEPVPPRGTYISDVVLGYMLEDTIIGWSPGNRVYTPQESQFYLSIGLVDGSHLPIGEQESHDECLPLVKRDPSARHLYFAVGVAFGKGSLMPKVGGDLCEGVGDHFVLLHVDIQEARARLVDSLPSAGVTQFICDSMPRLSAALYGHNGPRLSLAQPPCKRQAPGSNDCALHVWRNIVTALSSHHHIPVFGDVLVEPEDICRDVFRCMFNKYYF